jgi:hypothetical protein
MDEVYDYWNTDLKNLTRLQACDHFGPLHRAAVQLGNLNYQVENGGFSQWWDNEYGPEDIEDLLRLAQQGKNRGIQHFDTLLDLLRKVHSAAPCPRCGGSGYTGRRNYSEMDAFYDACEESGWDDVYYGLEGILDSYAEFLKGFGERRD